MNNKKYKNIIKREIKKKKYIYLCVAHLLMQSNFKF
jgi:hypothetical protein